jgi:hypothetical protein
MLRWRRENRREREREEADGKFTACSDTKTKKPCSIDKWARYQMLKT